MGTTNIKPEPTPVVIPVRIGNPEENATVSRQLLNDLQSFEKKCVEVGKSLKDAMSSAFAGASTGGHQALSNLSQRMSELTSVSQIENSKRLNDHKQTTKAQLAEMERREEAHKKVEETAKKRGELSGKLMTGAGDLATKSVSFGKNLALSTIGSEEGREGVKRGFEKIEPVVETGKSALEFGASALDVVQNVRELKGLRAAGSGIKSVAAGAMPVAGEAASAALGGGGLAAAGTSVATIGAGAAVGFAGGAALEYGTIRIGRWLGLIDKNAESTSEAFAGWWKASADAEKSTREIAMKQDAFNKKHEQEGINTRNAEKQEESRGRRIEANLAVARVADVETGVAAAAARSRDAMARADRLLHGGDTESADILGLKSLPPIESNRLENGLAYTAAVQAQMRLNQTEAGADKAKSQIGERSFFPEDANTSGHSGEAEKKTAPTGGAGRNILSIPSPLPPTHTFAFRMLQGTVGSVANSVLGPQATAIVTGGTYSQVGTQLAQSEQLAKWQEKITQASEREFHLLEQRRDTLTQMVATGSQMLQQAKDEVAAATNASTARKAQLSMLTKDQQRDVADILARVQKGKASRDDFLKLNALGINQGRIGRTINENLGKDVDPRLGKLYQDLGGNEDLDNALKRQKDITKALTDTQGRLNETLTKVDDAHKAWLAAQTAHSITAQNIEELKSKKEEFTSDNTGAAFDVKDAIKTVVEKDLVKAITDAIKRASSLINNAH